MQLLAQGAQEASLVGFDIGLGIGLFVVVVVVALVTPILLLARRIGLQAREINEALVESQRHTAPLADLRTTINHAEVITDGLRRGRSQLGGG